MNNLMMTNSNTNEPTMSSREIAELTGKQHKDVMRDIRVMFSQLEKDSAQFCAQYHDLTGRSLPCFHLNRYYTELLITGYDVRRRAAVIQRWFDLEKQVAQPQIPQSFAEALRLAADTQEQLEAESQQRQIAEKRRDSLQVTVGTHRHSISRFARTFTDVNSMKTKTDLFALGYLYRQGGAYRVYRKFSGLFEEKIEEFTGRTEIYPTESGKVLISDLRADGFLTLLKRFQH